VSSTLSVYLWGVLTLDDMTRGPIPLADHIATVSAYFTDHKSQTEPKTQDDYSKKFTCYLLSTCWKKIVRRIKSWRALGFIRFLTNTRPKDLQFLGKAWDRFPSDIEPGDKTLMRFLQACEKEKDLIKSLILDHIPFSLEIEKLLSISRSRSSALFSKETIPEFHGLVIGAFRGFLGAFLGIKREYKELVRMDYQALEI